MRREGGRSGLPSDHAQQETYEPHAQRHDGHFWVVDVGDGCADFREGAVFFVDSVEVELHPSTERSLDMAKEG